MAMRRIVSADDGPRLTVAQLTKSPTVVPKKLVSMVGQGFIADQLLRKGPAIPSGTLVYHESEPLYADDGAMNVEEFAEIPLTTTQTGEQRVAKGVYKGLGFRISQRAIDRNNFDRVQQDMVKVKNSFTKTYEDMMLSALLGALGTYTASNTWVTTTASTAGQGIYADLAKVTYNIGNADAETTDGTGEMKFHFQPNTIVLNDRVARLMLLNADIQKVLGVGSAATQQPLITGNATGLFSQAFGLNLVTSWRLDPDKAIVLEKGTVGGISDERPLGATELYEHKPTETWRSDVTRASAIFIDQPKAGCVITGINGGDHTLANFTS